MKKLFSIWALDDSGYACKAGDTNSVQKVLDHCALSQRAIASPFRKENYVHHDSLTLLNLGQ